MVFNAEKNYEMSKLHIKVKFKTKKNDNIILSGGHVTESLRLRNLIRLNNRFLNTISLILAVKSRHNK